MAFLNPFSDGGPGVGCGLALCLSPKGIVMTKNRAAKQAVRARMANTGEPYMTARHALADDPGPLAPTAQLERYLELGYAEHCGLTREAFRSWLAPLVSADVAEDFDVESGRLPVLLVIRQSRVSADQAMQHAIVRAKPGYVDMNPSEPAAFSTIESLDTPTCDAYLLHGFDPGDDLRNEPPSSAMESILAAGRTPITLDEALSAVALYPELLLHKHAFSVLGSRSDQPKVRQSVPAIWVSKGAARLGWCWNNNPHTWLGSASSAGRSAADL